MRTREREIARVSSEKSSKTFKTFLSLSSLNHTHTYTHKHTNTHTHSLFLSVSDLTRPLSFENKKRTAFPLFVAVIFPTPCASLPRVALAAQKKSTISKPSSPSPLFPLSL